MRHGKGEDDVSAHIGHGFGAQGDHILVGFHIADGDTVERAGYQEGDHQDGDNGAEERAQSTIGIPQNSVRRDCEEEYDGCHGEQGKTGPGEALAFIGAQRAIAFRRGEIVGALPFAEPGFDYIIIHQSADQDQQRGEGEGEVVIVQIVQRPTRFDRLRGGLGDAEEERLERGHHEIGREACRHTREYRRDTGDRVASGRREDDSAERHHDNIAGVDSQIAHDAREDEHGGKQEARCAGDHHAHPGRQEAGLFRDAGTDHHDQHHSKRGEAGQYAGHADEQGLQLASGQKIDDGNALAGHRVIDRCAQAGQGQ